MIKKGKKQQMGEKAKSVNSYVKVCAVDERVGLFFCWEGFGGRFLRNCTIPLVISTTHIVPNK